MPPDQQSEKLSTRLRFHPEPSPTVEPETRPSGAWTGHPLSEHERLEIFSTLRQRLLGDCLSHAEKRERRRGHAAGNLHPLAAEFRGGDRIASRPFARLGWGFS